jgi:hypothetical protein
LFGQTQTLSQLHLPLHHRQMLIVWSLAANKTNPEGLVHN